jgi:hypothetical protein
VLGELELEFVNPLFTVREVRAATPAKEARVATTPSRGSALIIFEAIH